MSHGVHRTFLLLAMRVVLVLSLVLLASDAHAQLGGLVNRARRAVQGTTQQAERPATTAAEQTASQTAAAVSSDEPLAPTGPMPVSPSGFAPGVDLLEWMEDLSPLRPGGDENAFRPLGFAASVPVIFPVADAAYQVVVRDAAGSPVTWQDLNYQALPELDAFGTLTLRNSPENRGRPLFVATPGEYRMAITANGHEIGAVDVEVKATTNDDPFDRRTTTTLVGPWTGLGVLAYDDDDDGSAANDALQFHYWLSPEGASKDGARYKAVLYRGSTRLNEDRGAEAAVWMSSPWWKPEDAQFFKDRGPLTLGDLADGEYRIEVGEEGRAPVHVFRFRMEGGAPVAHPRSALDHTPRADFLTPRRWRGQMQYLVWLEADA